MLEMTSYCGLDCSVCPAYIATSSGDSEALAKVASDWSKEFGMDVSVESVACDSCKSDTGRLCGYCLACGVRACAEERGVATCAHCDEYVCEVLEKCPAYTAKGRKNLEKIRAGL